MTAAHPFQSLRSFAGRLRTIRAQVRAERALSALPQHLQKDIGWPDRFGRFDGVIR